MVSDLADQRVCDFLIIFQIYDGTVQTAANFGKRKCPGNTDQSVRGMKQAVIE